MLTCIIYLKYLYSYDANTYLFILMGRTSNSYETQTS